MIKIEDEVSKIVKFIKTYYKKHHLNGAVIGVSGGKDSAVVAALLVRALGSDNVIGFTLPCHSNELDQEDAKVISDYYDFKLYNFDLTRVYDTFKDSLTNTIEFKNEDTINSDINLKPRLRMASLYYFASLLSTINKKTYLVVGTSNKSELFVGYFTKGGDNVNDMAIISDFTVSEVIQLGEYLKVPKDILYKIPSDGLSNLNDEDKLGVSYHTIEKYMNNDLDITDKDRNHIAYLHQNSFHKFSIPAYKKDTK